MSLRRGIRRHGDVLLATVLTASLQVELWTWDAPLRDRATAAGAALVLTGSLAWRARYPFVVLALTGAAVPVANVVFPDLEAPGTFAPILLLALYSAAAHTSGWRALTAGASALTVTVITVVEDPDPFSLGGLVFFLMVFGAPWAAGWAVRRRREREIELVTERDEKAIAAVTEERTRIARELHDVVAHAISVIVLQARGARRALEQEPEDARHAIDAIERTASQALSEMRRLLAILRADDAATLAPQPSLAHLEVLAGQVRDAGLPVEIRVDGEPRELSPGVDASAYRIVQEALTNALKHAGPARAVVTVRYGTGALELEVADDGAGASNGDGDGHGLVGMRERAAVFGGTIDAGPRQDGGYSVRARLPL